MLNWCLRYKNLEGYATNLELSPVLFQILQPQYLVLTFQIKTWTFNANPRFFYLGQSEQRRYTLLWIHSLQKNNDCILHKLAKDDIPSSVSIWCISIESLLSSDVSEYHKTKGVHFSRRLSQFNDDTYLFPDQYPLKILPWNLPFPNCSVVSCEKFIRPA